MRDLVVPALLGLGLYLLGVVWSAQVIEQQRLQPRPTLGPCSVAWDVFTSAGGWVQDCGQPISPRR